MSFTLADVLAAHPDYLRALRSLARRRHLSDPSEGLSQALLALTETTFDPAGPLPWIQVWRCAYNASRPSRTMGRSDARYSRPIQWDARKHDRPGPSAKGTELVTLLRARLAQSSPQRLAIADALMAGQNAADIAASLGVSRAAVSYHVRAMRRELTS